MFCCPCGISLLRPLPPAHHPSGPAPCRGGGIATDAYVLLHRARPAGSRFVGKLADRPAEASRARQGAVPLLLPAVPISLVGGGQSGRRSLACEGWMVPIA